MRSRSRRRPPPRPDVDIDRVAKKLSCVPDLLPPHVHSPKLMWRKGCNYPPVLDLDRWATTRAADCGPPSAQAAQEPLLVHVAWSGAWPKPQYEEDVEVRPPPPCMPL